MGKLLTLFSVFMLIASCGKDDASARTAESGKKELAYWSFWNKPEPQAQALAAIADAFAQEESGAKVKLIFNGRQAVVKLRSYLVAGNQVDLLEGDADQYLGLVTKEDLVLDLADVVSGKDYSGTQNFNDTMLNRVSDVLQVDAVQYGLPYIINVIAFFYSKESFETAGIAKPPATFDELLTVVEELNKVGIDPIALEGNVGFYQLWYLTGIMQKVAGERFLYDVIMDKSAESWDKPEIRKALEIEKQLVDSGAIPAESSGYQYPAAQNNIAIGKTAMELVGSWLTTELSQAVDEDFQWGIFPFPSIAEGQNENKIAIAPVALGIYKDSQYVEESKHFIRYLLTTANQEKIVEFGNVGVANKAVSWPKDLADGRNMLLSSDGAYLSDGNLTVFLSDFTVNSLIPSHTKFILGKMSIDEFIQNMKSETLKYWQQK